MTDNHSEHKFIILDLIIFLLSIYVLLVLLIDAIVKFPPETSRLLEIIDNVICLVFLYEFVHRFITAPSKLKFLEWGWIDLVSSIPSFEYLRYGRMIRLFRILRVFRAFRSVRHIVEHVYSSKAQGAFTTVTLVAGIMIIFSSISILQVEIAPECNIKTAEDAIWWSFVTVTTVGYGDKYPITSEGRIIAAFLMITGVGLFGTFTGFITSWFMKEKQKEEDTA